MQPLLLGSHFQCSIESWMTESTYCVIFLLGSSFWVNLWRAAHFKRHFILFLTSRIWRIERKGGERERERERERGDGKLLPGKLQFHFCDWGKRGRERERDEGRRCDLNGGFHGSTPKRPHEGEERVWKICMHKVHDLGHLFELRVEWTHSSGTSQL